MTGTLPPLDTNEFISPVAAALLLKDQTVRYIPGDGRYYRLALEEVDPDSTDRLLVVMLDINSPNPKIYGLRGPRSDAPWDRWTPGRWRAIGLPEEIYPAIVAILGALGWADHAPVFSAESAREFDS